MRMDSTTYQKNKTAKYTDDLFIKCFQKDPQFQVFTPYRVCPIGAHVDHNHGLVTGFAIDKGIYFSYLPDFSGKITVCSEQFEGEKTWHIRSVPMKAQGDWADHLRGAAFVLQKKYPIVTGICGVINGELPIGGLSSSAAVIISFLIALARVNQIQLTEEEIIALSQKAENDYVGVSCGTLDQSCEVYCRKNALLYLDTADGSHTLIPAGPQLKPFEIIIFCSGLERSLVSSAYNLRVKEAVSAAAALRTYSGMKEIPLSEIFLRDIPYDVFLNYQSRLPDVWRKRAEHFFKENDRVKKGIREWEKGDLDSFGKYCFQSGQSSIDKWETGSPELIRLFEILRKTPGVYGGRFSGAGFKGCCMALVDPDYAESVQYEVKKQYLSTFPNLSCRYSSHVCFLGNGVAL